MAQAGATTTQARSREAREEMINPADRLRCLVDALTASGELTDDWRSAFLSVPRHAFIPETIWRATGKALVPLQRVDDPDGWSELAYGEDFVITQVDDGVPTGPGMQGCAISSSASRPNVVAFMLAALEAEPGMTVCEIGAGTGYNAALLAARLGRARRALNAAGHDRWRITVTPHEQLITLAEPATQRLPSSTAEPSDAVRTAPVLSSGD